MKKLNVWLWLACLAVSVVLIGCPASDDSDDEEEKKSSPTDKFVGSWYTAYPYPPYDDGFTIAKDSDSYIFTYYNNGDPTNDIAYKATVDSYDVSGDYLFLNLKISDPSRSPWGLTVGEYARVCLKAVSSTQCEFATGTVGEYPNNTMTASSIEKLKSTFSFETGAFDKFGTYNKK